MDLVECFVCLTQARLLRKWKFCLKWLAFPYQLNTGSDPCSAPKGKIPFIDDNGELIADSTFIRSHIDKKYGFDFDDHLSNDRSAALWMAEKMCEEHLYFILVSSRWLDDKNFNRGPIKFFDKVPAPIRWLIIRKVRQNTAKTLLLQGLGRHNEQEQLQIFRKNIDYLADLLGKRDFFSGDNPSGADATIDSFLIAFKCEIFDSPFKTAIDHHENLLNYCQRMTEKDYPALIAA